ncbi:MAG: sugar ABC transporter permease [Caldilinea sp.]|nr:sugar ABC transporter permease [Caldilinea sp.]MDW8440075.1 sugar ABC transporter permease [Caldilineaceae bacterium]
MSTANIAQQGEQGIARSRRSPLRAFEESRLFPLALLLPILLFFVALNVIPTIWMIGMSFYSYSLMSPAPPSFIAIDNYVKIYNDADLWSAFSRTFVFVVLAVGIETVLGVLLGFLFWGSANMPGRRVALTLLFVPMVVTPVASGLFWRLIYEPTFGVANYFVQLLTGSKIDFLTNVNWAFGAVLFVDIWMWTPFMILMTLAALGSVPKAELEAAEVDRLSIWQRLWHVIWPHGKFILMLGVLLRTIDAYKTTDLVFLMTNGGPGNITELIGLKLYRYAFASLNIGFSSALAVILLLIAISFTSIYLWVLNLRRYREGA